MTEEQIRILLNLKSENARQLLEKREYSLYRTLQRELVHLVREYGITLPLNCLQFYYYFNSRSL